MSDVALDVKRQRTAVLIRLVERYGFLAIVLIYVLIFGAINTRFLRLQNLINISIQMVPLAVMALGVMFVLISGGLDLTAGVGVSIAAITMEAVFRSSGNIALALLFSFGIVLILGLVNGILVSKVKIESVIVTLIMMTVVQGLVFILTKLGNTINLSNPFFNLISRGTLLGIPNLVIIMIVSYLVAYLVLNHTKLGFYIVAIGNNKEGARLAGINVSRYVLFTFLISGFIMGLVAMLLAARILFVTPNIGGTPLLLDAIAAAVIGGVVISGGKGSVQGVLIGSLAIALINNSINLMDMHPSWNQFFKGLIIVIMMLVNRYLEILEVKSKLRD